MIYTASEVERLVSILVLNISSVISMNGRIKLKSLILV
jgi:hypothetical protein